MTIAAATGATDTRACSMCGAEVLHREHVVGDERCEPVWLRRGHASPCGLPCLGGGVKPAQIRGDGVHGYLDRCPRCGPLRVLPDVAQEMRQRAEAAKERADAATPGPLIAVAPRDQRGATVAHCGPTFTHEPLLRATSIRSLGVEPMPCGEAPGSWEQAERNALFFAGARTYVPALAADVLRCLDEIAKLTRERDELQQALDQEREEATAMRMRLDYIEVTKAQTEILKEQTAARAICAADGHTPEWLSCDPYSVDKDYRCTRCGDPLPEPEDATARTLPWNYCPDCRQDVEDDMRTGEYRDGSECTCIGCGVTYVATAFEDGSWQLIPYDQDEPQEAAQEDETS